MKRSSLEEDYRFLNDTEMFGSDRVQVRIGRLLLDSELQGVRTAAIELDSGSYVELIKELGSKVLFESVRGEERVLLSLNLPSGTRNVRITCGGYCPTCGKHL